MSFILCPIIITIILSFGYCLAQTQKSLFCDHYCLRNIGQNWNQLCAKCLAMIDSIEHKSDQNSTHFLLIEAENKKIIDKSSEEMSFKQKFSRIASRLFL